MKKLLIILMLLWSTQVYAVKPQMVCVDGYVFVVVISAVGGVAITQMYKQNSGGYEVPQPMRCEQ